MSNLVPPSLVIQLDVPRRVTTQVEVLLDGRAEEFAVLRGRE